jgi:threonylcarbamoyladenosine tRNA methylthiotransferase MtaB
MAHTFYTYTFGCRVNEAEKVMLDKKLLELGFVWSEQNPDFYIINSCAVTGKAEREVRQHIYQTRKKFPNTEIIVTGCAATNWIKNNIKVSGVDYLIENEKKLTLSTFLQTIIPDQQYHIISHMRNNVVNTQDKFLASGRLMVKIQDGCDRFCSYCIVPYLRGKPHSRLVHNIVKEIKRYDKHVKEVILTAINTECFGKDTGETLIQLIDAILTKTTVPKISFGSIHPWSITDEFLSYYQSIVPTNRFIPFFHIPIQSGSNTILQRMNRGYTKEEILKKLQQIKRINPKAFIGTDIIVGFPGETEREFQETYKFLTSAPIDKIHVFRYSSRPGTAAEKFPDELSPQEKQKRSQLLIEMKKRT